MLLDDCEECITGQEVSSATATAGHLAGNAESSDACCAPSWPPAGTGAGGGVPFDSFTECCTEGCFDLPDLAVGPGAPKDDCPDCWQGPSSISGSREDDLTESGSSVATPAEREMLSTSPKGLGALLKGLDEAAIQEIVSVFRGILNKASVGP